MLEAILPPGFKFRPTKEELVGYYLFNKIRRFEVPHDGLFVKRCDLYGEDEPSDIWKNFRDGGHDDEDLYFYTDLKRKTANGYRIDRRVGPSGQGTWHGEDSGVEFQVKIREKDDRYSWITGCKKRFSYRNAESEQNGLWIMHEFSCSVQPDTVLCVLRRNFKNAAATAADNSFNKKMKFSAEFDQRYKIPRIVDHVEPVHTEETYHVEQHDITDTGLEIFYYSNSNFNPVDEVEHSRPYHLDHIANIDHCGEPRDPAVLSFEYPNWEQLKHKQEQNGLLCINNNDFLSIPGALTEEGGDDFVQKLEEFVYGGDPSIQYPNGEQLKHDQELNGLVCTNNNDSLSIPGALTEEGGDDFVQKLEEFVYGGDRPAECALINTDQQQSNHEEASDVAEIGRNNSSHDIPWAHNFSAALLQANPGYLFSPNDEIGKIQNKFYMECAGLIDLSSKN